MTRVPNVIYLKEVWLDAQGMAEVQHPPVTAHSQQCHRTMVVSLCGVRVVMETRTHTHTNTHTYNVHLCILWFHREHVRELLCSCCKLPILKEGLTLKVM